MVELFVWLCIGLVLGGGGVCGVVYIGVLEVLEKLCVLVDCVVGMSMGVLVVGVWVVGMLLVVMC